VNVRQAEKVIGEPMVIMQLASEHRHEGMKIVHWALAKLGLNTDGGLTVYVCNTGAGRPEGEYFLSGFMEVGIPLLEDDFPMLAPMYGRRESPPIHRLLNWQEALVGILAHEGEHRRQHLSGCLRAGSEVAPEWVEYKALLRWREKRATPVIETLDETTRAQILRALNYRPATVDELARGLHADPALVLGTLEAHPRIATLARTRWSLTDFGEELLRFADPY
jgi:hypothetical protein